MNESVKTWQTQIKQHKRNTMPNRNALNVSCLDVAECLYDCHRCEHLELSSQPLMNAASAALSHSTSPGTGLTQSHHGTSHTLLPSSFCTNT